MGLFRKKMKQEHKIMLQHDRSAGTLQPEMHRPTTECPQPQHWSMIDSMTAELEVLEFLATMVTTIKPRLVVETGSFLGVSTEWIARGLERHPEVLTDLADPDLPSPVTAAGLREVLERTLHYYFMSPVRRNISRKSIIATKSIAPTNTASTALRKRRPK